MRRLCLIALACGLAASPAAAQGAASALPFTLVASPDTIRVYRFDIPAQPLPDALADFARQSALRVEFADASASAVRTSAVVGSLTAPAALRALLAGTGFEARFEDAETVVVSPGTSDAGSTQALTPVVVTHVVDQNVKAGVSHRLLRPALVTVAQ